MRVAEQLSEMRGQTVDDLVERVKTLEEELFRLRIQHSMGQTEAAAKLRPMRREIARAKTVLREKRGGQ
jgi:large subunit ribosomal protein L29